MGMLSNFVENLLVDGLYRGGAANTSGTVNSTAVVKGIWTASTAYAVGDIVVPHGSMTGAGGKFLRCIIAQNSGATNTLAIGNPGSTVTDNAAAMWQVLSGVPALQNRYVALFTCSKGVRANSTVYSSNDTITLTANDGKVHFYKCITGGTTAASQSTLYPGVANEGPITDGSATFTEQNDALDAGTAIVEVSGGSYARVAVANTLANWAGTQSSASTTSSTGTTGTTSNNNTIAFPAPTAQWHPTGGLVCGFAEYDNATGGNLLSWGLLTAGKNVSNGDAAPQFNAAQLSYQFDA